MPTREGDGFSWQASARYGERLRIMGAIALVAAGWGIGFFSGRMSAWVFPVAQDNTSARLAAIEQTLSRVAVTNAPPSAPANAPAAPSSASVPPASPPAPVGSAPEATGPEQRPSTPENPKPGGTGDERAISTAAAGEREKADEQRDSADRRSKDDIVLVNPEWRQAKSGARYRDADIDRAAMGDERAYAECERRYSSFRRSDGTYQPYGRSSRERCPFLR
jgi:hypothetical protein